MSVSPIVSPWVRFGLFVLRSVFLLLLLLIVTLLGSSDPIPLDLIALGFFSVAAVAVGIAPPASGVRGFVALAVGLALAIGTWAWIQTLPAIGSPLVNSIWTLTGGLGSISVEPGDTIAALVPTLLPFAVFASAMALFSDDTSAMFLFGFIGVAGTVDAALGLIQFLVFPNMLIFAPKMHYVESLTGTFVNRNTAATYFGLALIISISTAISATRLSSRDVKSKLSRATGAYTLRFRLTFWYAATLLNFAALMLTQSRGGIACTFIGLATTIVLLLLRAEDFPRRSASSRGGKPARNFIGAFTVAILAGLLGLLFAGRVLLRVGVNGTEDARFCVMPGMVRLLRENWLLGTGLGTFRVAFPAYRDPSCGLVGVWDMAHDFYIEGWITLGLPFVVICSTGLFALVAMCIRGIGARRRYRWPVVAGLGALILVVAHSALDFSIQIPGFAATFAALMGAVTTIALGRSVPRNNTRASSS